MTSNLLVDITYSERVKIENYQASPHVKRSGLAETPSINTARLDSDMPVV